jgi:3-isopropylmalate dehydrogenase
VARYKIACLPGDGVGKDVFKAAEIVMKALKFDAERIYGDIGWEFWCKEGEALPTRTLDLLRSTDACLFGAITSKPKEEADRELAPELRGKGLTYRSPIVRLRQEFNLHTNLRPCKAYPGNPLNHREGIDIVVFRENTEGLYSGIEFHPVPDEVFDAFLKYSPAAKRFADVPRDQMAVTVRLVTDKGCRNIVTRAFEYAKKYGRKKVTLVEKPNVLRETSGLMLRVAREVAAKYPDIEFEDVNIDAMCMWLIKNPKNYDVIVTSNMFGDILSDLCAQLVGGLGFASSGNIGDTYAVFEPTHGSAPKYAGLYKVNPMAMLLTVRLMLDWLGETRLAKRLEDAVESVVRVGTVRTYDMGGSATTLQVAEEVARKL